LAESERLATALGATTARVAEQETADILRRRRGDAREGTRRVSETAEVRFGRGERGGAPATSSMLRHPIGDNRDDDFRDAPTRPGGRDRRGRGVGPSRTLASGTVSIV
jgi:hypothetical protein